MPFCLPRYAAETFKAKLKDGTINPEKLSDMTSAERRSFFEKHFGGENAKQVNALFESKLLLKNQQTGMINWAKQVVGLKPEVRRDIISRIEKLDRVLNPVEQRAFLEDLAAQKLGVGVTVQEAQKITQLSKNLQEAKARGVEGRSNPAYGKARVELENYISDLKTTAKGFISTLKETPAKAALDVAGATKSLKATLDNSYIGRQGIKMMWSHPSIWFRNSRQSFSNIVRTFGGKAVMDEVKANIMSRPHYIDGTYKKMGIKLDTIEEAFPSKLLEKTPILGRVFKAADVGFTSQAYLNRADYADFLLKTAQKNGVDITSKVQLEAMGKLVNSTTGRGHLGPLEPSADTLNVALFSGRFLKSNIDTLTMHMFDKGGTSFVRKQAAMNLMKIITGTAGVMVLSNALKPGSVETDPRSANFGKIRIGDTRFDISGGMAPIIILASRVIQNSSKSSTTGKVTELNSGKFGSQTTTGVVADFFMNKLSPLFILGTHLVNRRDREGKPITFLGEARNLTEPISFSTFRELQNNPKAADTFASMILDALGIGANTYSKK